MQNQIEVNKKPEFYKGFKWAIPTAFADAVAICYFERGNLLYDTEAAYYLLPWGNEVPWGESLRYIRYYVQVMSIPTRGKPDLLDEKESKNVFKKNWRSPVEIDLFEHKIGKKERITTTQGGLYSLLWKGDLNYIRKKNIVIPAPITISDMRLNSSKRYLKEAFDAYKKNIKPGCAFVFVMPHDPTNSSSRHKQLRLKAKLKPFQHTKAHIDWSRDTSLRNKIAPTLSFYAYEFRNAYDDVYPALKAALYINPPKPKDDGEEDAVDMFRIDAHGIIQQL